MRAQLAVVLAILNGACVSHEARKPSPMRDLHWRSAGEVRALEISAILAALHLQNSSAIERVAEDSSRGEHFLFARVRIGAGISWSQSAFYALPASPSKPSEVWSGLADEHAASDSFMPVGPYHATGCLYFGDGPTLAYFLVLPDTAARSAVEGDTLVRKPGYYEWSGRRFRYSLPADSALAARCLGSTTPAR